MTLPADPIEALVILIIFGVLGLFIGWCLWKAISISYTYYRDNNPRKRNRYRKDVLPAPSKEAMRYTTTQSL